MAREQRTSKSSRRRSAAGRRPTLGRWWIAGALGAVAMAIIAWWILRPPERPDFSGEQAMAYLERQMIFGPRAPGTEGHALAGRFLVDTLRSMADRAGTQTFEQVLGGDSARTYTGMNITASFNLAPADGRRILLGAHWDTRPWADRDPDPAKRTEPVPGANDGASGVAVLLEMARIMSEHPPDAGVDIVLFDLEDAGDDQHDDGDQPYADPDSAESGTPFALGSTYFVEHSGGYRPAFGIVVDMVCDANLRIPMEANSLAAARPVVERVWAAAERVGADAFLRERGMAVYDDHVPFLERGIPVIDLIHTPFPSYWHTTADTPDKCSAASLEQVGEVLVEVIYGDDGAP